jgi:RNA polymerase primary sigma factor
VSAGVESAVKIHIARGDDLEWRDERGFTPLMIAASRNRATICRMLIDAGVQLDATDSLGRDARAIAMVFGAKEAQAVIDSKIADSMLAVAQSLQPVPTPVPAVPMIEEPPVAEETTTESHLMRDRPASIDALAGFPHASMRGIDHSTVLRPSDFDNAEKRSRIEVVDLGDDIDPDSLSAWEAETESTPSPTDLTLSTNASSAQEAISDHEPIDTSADWEDIEAFLPTRASDPPRADEAETQARLRLLLLRAIREGSVPLFAIEDLSAVDHQPAVPETVRIVQMVVNDLGAEVDERFEYRARRESFEVFVDSDETSDEEEVVTCALAAVDALTKPLNAPLRLYQRDYQRIPLLTAAGEVSLAQGMERGVERAVDALASWPAGMEIVLESARSVLSGIKALRWISAGPLQNEPEQFDFYPEATQEVATILVATHSDANDNLEDREPLAAANGDAFDEIAEFSLSIERLSGLPLASDPSAPSWRVYRDALASLYLSRSFLLGLSDTAQVDCSHSAADFARAMSQYQFCRDQMVTSNLKLVISIARIYRSIGLPIDDLIQEGNLGLMKAVDRFDWRRGNKFSTYATWWIRQNISRAIADKGRLIRVPVHLFEKMQRIAQVTRAFEKSRGLAPSIDEIASITCVPVHKLKALAATAQEPLSLDEIEDLDAIIAPHAEDDFSSADPMLVVEHRQLSASVDRFLSKLDIKQERIIRMRFGIGLRDWFTLEEIGEMLGVTRERVRQIEAKAIGRLKTPSRLDVFVQELGGQMPNRQPLGSLLNEGNGPLALPPALPALTRLTADPAGKPFLIDRLLEQARALGVPVLDERATSGNIWVELLEANDAPSRKLIRSLLALGFEFWAGKGYWK